MTSNMYDLQFSFINESCTAEYPGCTAGLVWTAWESVPDPYILTWILNLQLLKKHGIKLKGCFPLYRMVSEKSCNFTEEVSFSQGRLRVNET